MTSANPTLSPSAVFQFLAMSRPALLRRLVTKFSRPAAVLVLDMEDALWDVADAERTSELKRVGREHFTAFARSHADLFFHCSIGIRMNRFLSPEFGRDAEALVAVADRVRLACVMLPKVESSDELKQASDELARLGIAHGGLIPIIESRTAISRLDDIMTAARRCGCRFVAYGHYDYSLEAGHWPLLAPDEPAYWDHVAAIIRQVEQHGVNYLHPPCGHIADEAAQLDLVGRLRSVCARPFAILTVTGEQTRIILNAALRADLPPLRRLRSRLNLTDTQRRAQAEELRRAFETRCRDEVSFAVDTENGLFIPPHAYLAAMRYLERSLGEQHTR